MCRHQRPFPAAPKAPKARSHPHFLGPFTQGIQRAVWCISYARGENRDVIVGSHIHEVPFYDVIVAEHDEPNSVFSRALAKNNIMVDRYALKDFLSRYF